MHIGWDRNALSTLRGWIIRLLLTAFVLRALIPAGFMADFSNATNGVVKIVICSASGSKMLMLDADGKPAPIENASHHDAPCAFSGLATLALATLDTVQIVAPVVKSKTIAPKLAVALPPTRAGPVLGSRGPPQLS
ncbi:MAG: DUF2946 family protein [Hyphomicrobium sp.]